MKEEYADDEDAGCAQGGNEGDGVQGVCQYVRFFFPGGRNGRVDGQDERREQGECAAFGDAPLAQGEHAAADQQRGEYVREEYREYLQRGRRAGGDAPDGIVQKQFQKEGDEAVDPFQDGSQHGDCQRGEHEPFSFPRKPCRIDQSDAGKQGDDANGNHASTLADAEVKVKREISLPPVRQGVADSSICRSLEMCVRKNGPR